MMKKRFIFLLALSFCDVLLVRSSQFITELFSQPSQPNFAVFTKPPVKALDAALFSYASKASNTGFGVKIGSIKSITFYYNQPLSSGPRRKPSLQDEVKKYPYLEL